MWYRCKMLIICLLALAVSACSASSFERTGDGSTINLDQLSSAAKAKERLEIAQRLAQGPPVFELVPGDELTAFFDVNPKPTLAEYLISVGDVLRIEFFNDPENIETATVRPDGRISLPGIGPIIAAGLTPDSLARRVESSYREMLGQSQVTIDVIKSHSPVDRFVAMIGQTSKGLSMTTRVLPDGTISLPLLPPLEARGRQLKELEYDADAGYSALGLDINVSLIPETLRPPSTMVIGEVPRPGRVPLDRPQTVLMAVAQAGGVLPTGAIKSVRLIYMDSDGQPRMRVINLKEVMNLKLEDDMIVPDNSVIYVPPTDLAKANRIAKEITGMLPNNVGFNAAYIINQPTGGTVLP